MRSLRVVLGSAPDPTPIDSAQGWWQHHRAAASIEALPIDQAILGGFSADRVGYAFASGYQAALRALVPDLPPDCVASLCVTERGGGHPRAIETRLDPQSGGGYRVTGKKRWVTLAGVAGVLLVVASAGLDAEGRNRLRLVRIPTTLRGVARRPMAEAPFTPEISHDEVDLSGVLVSEADLCPGDGYTRYVRPFRTTEDIYLIASILAYLVREVRLHGFPPLHAERLAGLLASLRALAAADPSAPETHLALAGILDLARGPIDEIDRVWAKTESPAHARWERDRLVLTVAANVRERRRARAWERLSAEVSCGDESTGGMGDGA
jgi:hypothetical protein